MDARLPPVRVKRVATTISRHFGRDVAWPVGEAEPRWDERA
ncbi:hypothetical protein [Lentzea sp. NPDC092896]